MKKYLITALLVIVAVIGHAQIKVEVSETVELLSILARTAGYQEYCHDVAGQYTKDTEAWFAPYKQHEAVALAWNLNTTYGISHDKVMSMAIHLDIQKGKIKFLGDKSDLVENWKNVDITDFIQKLNKFYKDTHFRKFFEQHRTFYEDGIKNFEAEVMPIFHQDWYSKFYGNEAKEKFAVIVGFTIGGHNYGPSRQISGQPREVFSIMGYYINPTTSQFQSFPYVLIHEFNHSFVNPLLDNAANAALMEKIGQRLLFWSLLEMQRQAYPDWHIVINESIVRAAVLIYLKDNGLVDNQTLESMYDEIWRNGFRWTPELVTCLRNYANNRDKYKTLNDYYPEIAKCFQKYIDDEIVRMKNSLE